ncbi:hypothetical protein LEP1GSC158_5440 [Leptospira interrogans serovar Zanoni str. LT2156]|uniref:Uncharacterized protein n=1 Tax=Leptospira interrogans serovar Zanoni str. LT2156 TaxID=1001601 RepID=M6HHI6_LEPIR|nr:hypothetical protein LEP1GSC158_5440 [Leptospira interrogans serovar Zanoni str. LT2156]
MVLCNKIAEGIDTRNIGESEDVEFSRAPIEARDVEFQEWWSLYKEIFRKILDSPEKEGICGNYHKS